MSRVACSWAAAGQQLRRWVLVALYICSSVNCRCVEWSCCKRMMLGVASYSLRPSHLPLGRPLPMPPLVLRSADLSLSSLHSRVQAQGPCCACLVHVPGRGWPPLLPGTGCAPAASKSRRPGSAPHSVAGSLGPAPRGLMPGSVPHSVARGLGPRASVARDQGPGPRARRGVAWLDTRGVQVLHRRLLRPGSGSRARSSARSPCARPRPCGTSSRSAPGPPSP